VTFSFLPSDMVTQILNFGLPAPIDIQVVGNNLEGNQQYANALLEQVKFVPGSLTRASNSRSMNPTCTLRWIARKRNRSASMRRPSRRTY